MIAIAMIAFFLIVLAWLLAPSSGTKAETEAPAPTTPLVTSEAAA